jgi:hypothetical protein
MPVREGGDAMAPGQRIQNICLKPKQEWDAIAGEPTSTADLLKNYALPLAAIGAVAGFIGNTFVGRNTPIASGLLGAILSLAISIGAVYALALIIDALAPRFGGQKNPAQALKVAVYSATPLWVAGVLAVVPGLGRLIWLAFFYGLYVLYLGLQRLMKAPPEKVLGYTAAIGGCWLAILVVEVSVIGSFLGDTVVAVSGIR